MGSNSSKNKKDFQSVSPLPVDINPKKTKASENASIQESNQDYMEKYSTKNLNIRLQESTDLNLSNQSETNNYDLTEGQARRTLIAQCDDECSEITEFLFVGGEKIASSREILQEKDITRIINCSGSIINNHFENDNKFKYLTLDMVDGAQDDISWFFCEIIQFIETNRYYGKNTLIHCQKGISRSCSFAIAYIMWASGKANICVLMIAHNVCSLIVFVVSDWKTSYEYVKERRIVCAPNTAFTCNLIEIGDILHGESKNIPMLLRLARHLPSDESTPTLKIIRQSDDRKLSYPKKGWLHSDGVFVLRPVDGRQTTIYIWKGKNAHVNVVKIAFMLVEDMLGIVTSSTRIVEIQEHAEPSEFFDHIVNDTSLQSVLEYTDLFRIEDFVPPDDTTKNIKRLRVADAVGCENNHGPINNLNTVLNRTTTPVKRTNSKMDESSSTINPKDIKAPSFPSPPLHTPVMSFQTPTSDSVSANTPRRTPLAPSLMITPNTPDGQSRRKFILHETQSASFDEKDNVRRTHVTESVVSSIPSRVEEEDYSQISNSYVAVEIETKKEKPQLFQYIPQKNSGPAEGRRVSITSAVWQQLKVYDDDDLDQVGYV